MASWRRVLSSLAGAWLLGGSPATAQEAPPQAAGSLRGIVYDDDFDAPLPLARIRVVETGQETVTTDQGNYLLTVAPGTYTVVFSKEGYVRQVRAGVVVVAGKLTDLDARLVGDVVEMEEFIVQDALQLAPGSEAALLELRFESPSLLDSISSELLGRAGASDAADALTLVSGATVQEGKFAVVRGLPDRYVSSQLNGVRLPSADEDTRAVELDQFPSAVIESIQVSKTFTPDQQGDASGGAVDVRLKTIPDQTVFRLSTQFTYDSQATGSDFLTYEGGGVDFWGTDDAGRRVQPLRKSWEGAVGTTEGDAPDEYKFSAALGGKRDLSSGVRIGGYASFFYERDGTFYDNGRNDSLWVKNPGEPLSPELVQADTDPKTKLFDITKGTDSVQWGGLASLGIETDRHSLAATYLYTRTTEDEATLAEDTRGKEFFFPGYDPNDPMGPGNTPNDRSFAPYIRTETLEYTERTADSLQLTGRHTLPFEGPTLGAVDFGEPELDWTLSHSTAGLNQPDKRQFGEAWLAESFNPGVPPFLPPFTEPPTHIPFKPSANFNLGNVQHIFKTIDETSEQATVNLKLPFEWEREEGYVKLGWFDDSVEREFRQETFSNFGDNGASFEAPFEDHWSEVFPDEDHPIRASAFDVNYDGDIDVSAWYAMADLPLTKSLSLIGGARVESTDIAVAVDPDNNATWFPPGASGPVKLNPGDADVDFSQDDVLPAVGLVFEATDSLTLRGSYSQTVARQTFRELTPVIQQEFLGGPIFIGNPELQMAALKNYDLRLDYEPYRGGLFSVSWFYKDLQDPIENVQRLAGFVFTTVRNYPEGKLSGWELEARQDLGELWKDLQGLSVGANATFIDSEVTLPKDEQEIFAGPAIDAPITTRDATNAPEHLYNLYFTYDLPETGTQLGVFYTVRGDTLVAGAGAASGNFVPNVYEEQYGTLNVSVTQRLGPHWSIGLKAKNITNPAIKEIYRSDFTEETTKSSYTKGVEISFGISFSN